MWSLAISFECKLHVYVHMCNNYYIAMYIEFHAKPHVHLHVQ